MYLVIIPQNPAEPEGVLPRNLVPKLDVVGKHSELGLVIPATWQ